MKPEDVPEEWVKAAFDAIDCGDPSDEGQTYYDDVRLGVAAVAPLILQSAADKADNQAGPAQRGADG